MRQTATAEVRLDEGKAMTCSAARWGTRRFGFEQRQLRSNFVAARLDETENRAQQPGNLGNVGLNGPTLTSRRGLVMLAPERARVGVIAAPDLAQGVTAPAEQPHRP